MSYEPGVLQAAIRAANKRKASPRVKKALILAGLVESNLQHKKYSSVGSGDRDSVGFLQQRPSQGWGRPGESVEQDTNQFLDHALKLNATGRYGSAGQLAQAVQRSAFPDRYDARSAEADKLLKGALGSTQEPSATRDASNATTLGSIPGTSPETSSAPSVFDVIRRYAIATDTDLTDEERTMQQQLLSAAIRTQAPAALPTPTTPRVPSLSSSQPSQSTSRGERGKFKITGPNPGRLKPYLVDFAEQVAGVLGKPLTGSDGTGHSYRTATGGVSQHSSGEATDIPLSGRALLEAGQAALIAAGMPEAQARKQKGGLYNINGHQIIFNDYQQVSGSPHTDHLHISAKPKRRK